MSVRRMNINYSLSTSWVRFKMSLAKEQIEIDFQKYQEGCVECVACQGLIEVEDDEERQELKDNPDYLKLCTYCKEKHEND